MHSLSKRSNLAGYRCAFVAGDPPLVGELLAVRKNLGLMMPGPQQRAMVAALDDDAHVVEQHATGTPPAAPSSARPSSAAGFRDRPLRGVALPLGHPVGEDCWDDRRLARRARHPGRARRLLRPAGRQHVRVAFTATDERGAAAVARLA